MTKLLRYALLFAVLATVTSIMPEALAAAQAAPDLWSGLGAFRDVFASAFGGCGLAMAITNQELMDVANTTFQSKFDEIFCDGVAPGPWSLYTEEIPTSSKVNEIDVLESMPVVRKWEGEKRYQDIFASKLAVTIDKYEKSFQIDRLDLVGDKIGAIGRRIDLFLGSDGGAIYDLICFTALTAGLIGYDGVALFSASHPRGRAGGNQSNRGTTALSFAVHDTIMAAGANLTDANDEPLRIAYDTMIVGPTNKKLGQEITQSTERILPVNASGVEASASVVAAASIPNVFGGGEMTLVVDPRLSGSKANKVIYVDTKRGPRPVVLFVMRKPEPITQFKMEDEARFNLDKMRGSVECDVVACAGAWQTAHLIDV